MDMSWYKDIYCCSNKSEVDVLNKQKEKAREILGNNYTLVYRSFRKVLESNFYYKVFRSRRCQVLFNIFAPIILNDLDQEDPNIWEKVQGIFISDNALIKYKKEILKGATQVLLVDDIMIHGRGLEQLYESLDPDYKLQNIKVYVIVKNNESYGLKEEFLHRLKAEIPVFEWGWKELSSQLVNLIYYNATPYISYVGSYYGELFDDKSNCKVKFSDLVQQKQVNLIDNTNETQKKMKETSSVIFENNDVPLFFDNLCYACCLRIYENKDSGKRTLVPYAFLKNFSMDDAEAVSSFLAEKLDHKKFRSVCKDLQMKNYSNELDKKQYLAYKMRLVNAFVNLFYGIYVADRYDLSLENWTFDVAQFNICYGDNIAEEALNLVFADFSDFVNLPVWEKKYVNDFQEDEELASLFDETMDQANSMQLPILREKMEQYFFENGMIDERRAKKFLPRKNGITIKKILGKASVSFPKNELISVLLNAWDSGIASGSTLAPVGKDIVAMYVAAGEQSFRYDIESNKSAIEYILKKHREVFFRDREIVKAEISDYIDREYSDNPEKKDRLYNLIGKNLEKLENLNIPAILN